MARGERDACSRLNRRRARGILDAAKISASGQSSSIDAWSADVARRTSEWQVPLIPLSRLGMSRTPEEGFLESNILKLIGTGQEAHAYLDPKFGVVYKLFDLRGEGKLGKKVQFRKVSENEFDLAYLGATLEETLEKIIVLHDAGAHPTEIVGIAESGDFLIVKQPAAMARSYSFVTEKLTTVQQEQYETDREAAIHLIKGITCNCPGLRQTIAVCHVNTQSWLVTDLHARNIMLGADGAPTIIDALIGPVPPEAMEILAPLADAVRRARDWRQTGNFPAGSTFDDVDDREL